MNTQDHPPPSKLTQLQDGDLFTGCIVFFCSIVKNLSVTGSKKGINTDFCSHSKVASRALLNHSVAKV